MGRWGDGEMGRLNKFINIHCITGFYITASFIVDSDQVVWWRIDNPPSMALYFCLLSLTQFATSTLITQKDLIFAFYKDEL